MEMDHAALIVDPELLPAFLVRVVDVVTLAGVSGFAQGSPVLPDDTSAQSALDVAAADRGELPGGDHVPVANPKIELTALGAGLARRLILLRLLYQVSKSHVQTQAA